MSRHRNESGRPQGRGSDRRKIAGRRRFQPLVEPMERLLLLSFTVTKTGDTFDDQGNPDQGTLRWAITQADEGGGEVDFDLPGGGVHTLTPTKALPYVDSGVTINGYSQPGSNPNSLAVGDNAVLTIAINAPGGVANAPDLPVDGGGVTIKGLILNNSPSGPGLGLYAAAFATIQGNFFGVNPSGTGAAANSFAGIYLQDASGNTIGGTTPAARNIISGNGIVGIALQGAAPRAT